MIEFQKNVLNLLFWVIQTKGKIQPHIDVMYTLTFMTLFPMLTPSIKHFVTYNGNRCTPYRLPSVEAQKYSFLSKKNKNKNKEISSGG